MKRPIEQYIIEVMKRHGINQSQIAVHLGINRSEISLILNRGVTPSDETCIKLAEFAGDSPEKVLLLAAQSKAPKESKPFWEDIFQKLAKTGTFTIIALLFMLSVYSSASPLAYPSEQEVRNGKSHTIHYATIKSFLNKIVTFGTFLAGIMRHRWNSFIRVGYAGAIQH